MQTRTIVLFSLALFVGVVGVWAGLNLPRPYTYHGSYIREDVPAEDFTLKDQYGASFRLSDRQGKVVLMFFGYTNCPDVCPITLAQYKQIKAALVGQSDQVEFVFVTVDPERDTQEQIRSYLDKFDPEFVGLGGSEAELKPVWKRYGIYQESHSHAEEEKPLYEVDHSTNIFAIDQQGNLRLTYAFGYEVEQITQDVLQLLKQ